MKVLVGDITNYPIDKLIINSLESSLYQPIVEIAGQEHLVWEDEEHYMSRRSLIELRELFDSVDVGEVVLRQESAYDEMVGQAPKHNSNRLEIPLSR